MLFPGQGAQSVGMLDDLASDHAAIGQTLDEASQILDYDVAALISEGPASIVDQTVYTQPLMLAADVAIYRAWLAAGGQKPSFVAGHSLGEYAALVAAGALSFVEALSVTTRRAQAMTDAVADVEVAMAAVIGLDDASVESVCNSAAEASGEIVSPANYNAPGQVVVAGQAGAVEKASEQAREAGARMVRPIAVSVPSHCALMRPAVASLEAALDATELATPDITVLHNVDAASRSERADIQRALVEQLWQPVRWVDCVERMRDAGANMFYECGPGRVLAGLNKRIDKTLDTVSLGDASAFDRAVRETG
ncbi:ACP S-malonyltransferase [Salinisphaera sp. USBA-960]|uniref:ACP S-malonyltransferase n=1 Tax=Salinisphaera orenii TaxID=856731 RepID=UPI000DBE263E|nr:ACP S-malonyltransferase [Salifodinibacter halophilus]NNC25694.1 ACP S-malonyltransferase [Salifodinibacter halophilus]